MFTKKLDPSSSAQLLDVFNFFNFELCFAQFLAKRVVQPIKTYSMYEPFHPLT